MDEFWHEDDYSWIEFGTLRSNASTLFPRRSLRIDALPEPKRVFVGGNFKLEKYISSFKFSILENEMDEDEEFFFFLFSRVNSFDGAKVYIYIYRGVKSNGSAENRGVRQSGYSFESICEMIEGQSREQIDRGRIRRLETSKESRWTSEARKRFTIQRIPVPEIVILPKHRGKNSRKSRRIKRRPVFCNNKRPRRGERRNGKLLSRPTCRGVLPLTVVYLEQLLSPFLS